MKRLALALFAVSMALLPADLGAQESPQQQAYREKREELLQELERTQAQLADIRAQRVELQTRIENVIASMMEERARALLMSEEQGALQELDAILTTAQNNLLDQRDRFLTLGEAVRSRAGAVLVVLLRADSSAQPQQLQNASLQVNGVAVDDRSYSAAANEALQIGAVDQLYRATVLPTDHTVTVAITLNGRQLTRTLNVSAARESVTYVQFAVRNGQLIPTTWTSRGTTPF
ncbi:MAG: hypothetical protein ACRENI_13080 [Gemmatimonadaceae bacterium]